MKGNKKRSLYTPIWLLLALLAIGLIPRANANEGWVSVGGNAVLYDKGVAVAEIGCDTWNGNTAINFYRKYNQPGKVNLGSARIVVGGKPAIGHSLNGVVITIADSDILRRLLANSGGEQQASFSDNTFITLNAGNFNEVAVPVLYGCLNK